jgi:hypothetical protein
MLSIDRSYQTKSDTQAEVAGGLCDSPLKTRYPRLADDHMDQMDP